MKHPVLFLFAFIVLAACDAGVESRREAVPPAENQSTLASTPAPLTPAGPATTIAANAELPLQWAASVVRLDPLARQAPATAKLFGTAAGDPAMNGLYVHVAFFVSPAEGWRVFRIGDVLDYRILSEGPGRVDLEVDESVMDPASGAISSRTRRLIIGWSAPTDGAPAATVTVTPAE